MLQKQAALKGNVRCTCYNPVTNTSHVVIRPRVSNERLLRVGGIGAASSTSLILLAAMVYYLVRRLKGNNLNQVDNNPKAFYARRQGKSKNWAGGH